MLVKKLVLVSEGQTDKVLDLSGDLSQLKQSVFTIKEGVQYRIRIEFFVQHEIVTGLKYVQKTYRKGIQGNSILFVNLSLSLSNISSSCQWIRWPTWSEVMHPRENSSRTPHHWRMRRPECFTAGITPSLLSLRTTTAMSISRYILDRDFFFNNSIFNSVSFLFKILSGNGHSRSRKTGDDDVDDASCPKCEQAGEKWTFSCLFVWFTHALLSSKTFGPSKHERALIVHFSCFLLYPPAQNFWSYLSLFFYLLSLLPSHRLVPIS